MILFEPELKNFEFFPRKITYDSNSPTSSKPFPANWHSDFEFFYVVTGSGRLLLDSRMSIKEIAYAVGFENENYFSEFFSAKVGISALKFRNREMPTTRKSIL